MTCSNLNSPGGGEVAVEDVAPSDEAAPKAADAVPLLSTICRPLRPSAAEVDLFHFRETGCHDMVLQITCHVSRQSLNFKARFRGPVRKGRASAHLLILHFRHSQTRRLSLGIYASSSSSLSLALLLGYITTGLVCKGVCANEILRCP